MRDNDWYREVGDAHSFSVQGDDDYCYGAGGGGAGEGNGDGNGGLGYHGYSIVSCTEDLAELPHA